jgi:hypothetical protein
LKREIWFGVWCLVLGVKVDPEVFNTICETRNVVSYLPNTLSKKLYLPDTESSLTPNPKLQTPNSKSFFRLGDQLITLEKQGLHKASYLLVSLHSNEHDAISTMSRFAEDRQVNFLRLMNQDKKNVEALFLDRQISFDPNSIFTRSGRKACLLSNKYLDRITDMEIRQFAQFMLDEMPSEETIVTLHAEDSYTINHYISGGKKGRSARYIFKSADYKPSSYFLTTSEEIYNSLVQKNCNVVLLHKTKAKDDGSLGIYCARTGKPYVSIETAAGDKVAQEEMLEMLHSILK